jgi:hypothetical protein
MHLILDAGLALTDILPVAANPAVVPSTVHRRMICMCISRVNLLIISAGATEIAKTINSVSFQMETVVTVIIWESVSPSLLDRTAMASNITKSAVATIKFTRTGAKPISRGGPVFRMRVTATVKLLLSKSLT